MKVLPAFVDETGALNSAIQRQPVYGIGLLLVRDPEKVTDGFYRLHYDFASIRAAQRSKLREEIRQGNLSPTHGELDRLMWSTRHHEYKFTDVTHHNLQQYLNLLNLYFSCACFEFHALLLDRSQLEFSLSRWDNDAWRAYVKLGRELLEQRLNSPAFVLVDFQDKPNAASVAVESEFCAVKQVKGCLRVSSETQVFLQLTDVLLGCVAFDLRDKNHFYAQDSKRAKAKRNLVSLMREKLGLIADQPIVTIQQQVWETAAPSPFTVSLYH